MRTVVCVGVRPVDRDRERAWEYVQRYWESHGFEVFAGDVDGEFSRSGARNAAARAAGDWDVALFADAETFPNKVACARRAAELATRGHWVNVARDYGRLSAGVTRRVLDAGYWPDRRDCFWRRGGPPPGGIVALPRALWERIGGYDEGFRGWGYEDSALLAAAQALGNPPKWIADGFVFHLWHEESDRRAKRASDVQYQRNRTRYHRYSAARHDPAAMAALLEGLKREDQDT